MTKIKTGFLIWLTLLLSMTSSVFAEEELLPPWEAFTLDARIDGDKIIATWNIVDGYYLYIDKIKFSTSSEDIKLGDPQLPKGKKKHGILPDGTEGEVEVYTKTTDIVIPILEAPAGDFTLKARSQGCSDVHGVCLIRYNYTKDLSLGNAVASTGNAVNDVQDLSDQLGIGGIGDNSNTTTVLQPTEAFQPTVTVEDNHIVVHWMIADDYYMYRNTYGLVAKTEGVTIGEPIIPEGKMKEGVRPDNTIGPVETYTNNVTIKYPIHAPTGTKSIDVDVLGQGCAESLGICLDALKLPHTLDVSSIDFLNSFVPVTDSSSSESTTAKESASGLSTTDIVIALAVALLAGFGLTFTPCVLPMLPILTSIIAGQGENITKAKGGMLAIVYVLGTAVVWTIAGWFAGKTGEQLNQYLVADYVVVPLASIIFLFALGMFGLFNIQLPSSLQSKAQESSSKLKGGTFLGVFIMGVIASVIAGACVGPILLTNLTIALESQSPTLGAGIMLMLALGMGVPIVMIGFGAGALLPKAGAWMDTVKYVFGVILIGLALYFVSPVKWMPILHMWAIFFIITGVYMRATQPLPEGSNGWKYLGKGIGTVLLIWGALALIGAFQGNRDIMKPVSFNFSSGGTTTSTSKELFTTVTNVEQLEEQMALAKQQGKPVFIDYYGDWCPDCITMLKTTFADERVIKRLGENFVVIKADISEPTSDEAVALKKRFKVFGAPYMVILDKDGNIAGDIIGYRDADELLEFLDSIKL